MPEPFQEEEARTHVSSRASIIKGKIKETDHVKKVIAVCAALLLVVTMVVILHGPSKKHSDDAKTESKAPSATGTFDLKSYQQQVDEAERARAHKQVKDAVREADNPRVKAGVIPRSDDDDDSDVSYVKQEWRKPMIWDVPHKNGQGNQASAQRGRRAETRVQMIRRLEEERAAQNEMREQRLRQHLDELKRQQAEIFHRREEAQ